MTAPDTATPTAPHWWRRNALALAALVVLIPLTVGVIAANEWSQYDAGHATQPIIVQAGDAARYDGAGIGPARAEFTDNPAAPAGSRVLRTTTLITPLDGPIACATPVLRELTGAKRQWDEASGLLDLDYDPEAHSTCDSERPIRYSLTLHYLLPDDAVGPFALDLAGDPLPQFVRLVIEP